ncbi:hypothetical protein JMM81_07350 [Bacillus sp. V3B]|uniref:hypothetical protein n=1 Tax=Bacillus sp. V3B TaxID=2804915 RepID=UPI0021091BF5|nr:hypothetical protein [Bacillus sp. V3B]MCQ6274785.1 hypothetical protein [Bacillus sp. V3B]
MLHANDTLKEEEIKAFTRFCRSLEIPEEKEDEIFTSSLNIRSDILKEILDHLKTKLQKHYLAAITQNRKEEQQEIISFFVDELRITEDERVRLEVLSKKGYRRN